MLCSVDLMIGMVNFDINVDWSSGVCGYGYVYLGVIVLFGMV